MDENVLIPSICKIYIKLYVMVSRLLWLVFGIRSGEKSFPVAKDHTTGEGGELQHTLGIRVERRPLL
jgi:hypothetical protein